MNGIIEGLIALLSTIGLGAVGHLYARGNRCERKVNEHAVSLATLTERLGSIDEGLQGHMEREEVRLASIHTAVTSVQQAVARIEGRMST